jgi:hypothetical protein
MRKSSLAIFFAACLFSSMAMAGSNNPTSLGAVSSNINSTAGFFTSGNINTSAWTTTGLLFGSAAATYNDATSSGVVTNQGLSSFGIPTLTATSPTTYTNSGTVIIRGAPVSGTNVTQTNAAALLVETGHVRILAGNLALPFGSYSGGSVNVGTGSVNISGNQSVASWTTSGVLFRANAVTLTDTTGTGTIAIRAASSLAASTLASTSAVTLTDAATLYISGAPLAGTNTTITAGSALYIAAGDLKLAAGQIVLGSSPFVSSVAPTISSGFGTAPSIVNGTSASFSLNVGTGGTASSGVIGLPTATNGWNCTCNDITTTSTTVGFCKQTVSTTTSATIGNFSTGAISSPWNASDVLNVNCFAR